MDATAIATWAAVAVAIIVPLVTTIYLLGRTATTRADLEALRTECSEDRATMTSDFKHGLRNAQQSVLALDQLVKAEFDKVWGSHGRVERDYSRRDDVQAMETRISSKIDRLEGKVDEMGNNIIEFFRNEARKA